MSNTTIQYTIQPGNTLFGIAENHDVTLTDIIAANNDITVENADSIEAGQVINIPNQPVEAIGEENEIDLTFPVLLCRSKSKTTLSVSQYKNIRWAVMFVPSSEGDKINQGEKITMDGQECDISKEILPDRLKSLNEDEVRAIKEMKEGSSNPIKVREEYPELYIYSATHKQDIDLNNENDYKDGDIILRVAGKKLKFSASFENGRESVSVASLHVDSGAVGKFPFFENYERHIMFVQPFFLLKHLWARAMDRIPGQYDWEVDKNSLKSQNLLTAKPEDVGVEYYRYVEHLIKKYADSGEYSGIVSPEIDKELKWTLTADAASQTYKAINDLEIPLEIGKKYPTASKDQKNERVNRMLEHVHNAVKGYNNRSPKPSTPITGLRITSIYNNKIAPHKRLGAVDLAGYGDCFRQDGEHGNGFDPDEMIAFLTLLMRSRGDKNESTKFFQSFIVDCPYVVKRMNEDYNGGETLKDLLTKGPCYVAMDKKDDDKSVPHNNHIHAQNGTAYINARLGTERPCAECILLGSCTKLERRRVLVASVSNKRKEDISATIHLEAVTVGGTAKQSANVASGENQDFDGRTFVGGQWIRITVGENSHYIDLRSQDAGDFIGDIIKDDKANKIGQGLIIRIIIKKDDITATAYNKRKKPTISKDLTILQDEPIWPR